jgi:hypothetical protein
VDDLVILRYVFLNCIKKNRKFCGEKIVIRPFLVTHTAYEKFFVSVFGVRKTISFLVYNHGYETFLRVLFRTAYAL